VIKSTVTGYCVDLLGVDAPSIGDKVLQTVCYPGVTDNQEFQTVAKADGTFLLRTVKAHLCVDAPGTGSNSSGTGLVLASCTLGSAENQMYRRSARSSGFYLVNVKSGLCLDAIGTSASDTAVNTQLTLTKCMADDLMTWTFQ